MSSAQVIWELLGEELIVSGEQGQLPPGFRFHPTDEELITYYLASKVFNGALCGVDDIVEVDLNLCEPWELPDVAKIGEREWYFFSLRDRKYPTGLRTNRATGAGYWKATGKDREVRAAGTGALVGMKKTLVFYKGRAPRAEKTKWVLHEYRLEGDYSCRHTCKEEWVICRIFNKSAAAAAADQKKSQYYNNNTDNQAPCYFDPSPYSPTAAALPDLQTLESPIQSLLQNNNNHHHLFIHPHEPNPNSNLYFPQPSSNIQSFLKSQFIPGDNSLGPPQAEALSNWLDVYLQQNPGICELAFGGQLPLLGVGGGGDLCSLWGPP